MRLVLKRKPREWFQVDGPCEICLVRWEDGAAVLAIDAPATTTIMREELAQLDLPATTGLTFRRKPKYRPGPAVLPDPPRHTMRVSGPCRIQFSRWTGCQAVFHFKAPVSTRIVRGELPPDAIAEAA